MHTTTIPTSGPYAAVAALLATPLPIPPDAPPRVVIEAEINHLIDILDAFDAASEDLEPDADLEPWLAGGYLPGRTAIDAEEECEDEGAACEDEGADTDREPVLGVPEGWTGAQWPPCDGLDLELDESDHEYSGGMSATDDEPIFGRIPTPSALVGSAVRA